MVKLPVLIKLTAPMPAAEANVPMLLDALVREALPVPPSNKLLAVKAALCVRAPEANKLKVLPVAVIAPAMLILPP